MDFVDAILLRLADDALRASVFDEMALGQIVAAAHDLSGVELGPPLTPVFEQLRFCFRDERSVSVTGSWLTMGRTDRSELVFSATGLASPLPRIDSLWTGSVIASSGGGNAVVDRVDLEYLDLVGIDHEIGTLPSDPAEREARRRAVLLARIRATLAQPAAFDDAELARLLVRLEVGSVTELMTGPQVATGATMRIHYAPSADAPARRRQFAVAAALLIRPATSSIAALLDDTRRLRPYLDHLGFAAPRDAGDRSRRSPVIVWVVPGELFDDDAWPGAPSGTPPDQRRARRRMWAGAWLSREGIGLVVPPN